MKVNEIAEKLNADEMVTVIIRDRKGKTAYHLFEKASELRTLIKYEAFDGNLEVNAIGIGKNQILTINASVAKQPKAKEEKAND